MNKHVHEKVGRPMVPHDGGNVDPLDTTDPKGQVNAQ